MPSLVTSVAFSSSPIIDLTGYRQRETIEPRTFCVDAIVQPLHPLGQRFVNISSLGVRACPQRGVDDNIRSGAVDDRFQFGLLLGGHFELSQRLLKIVQERLPL